MSHNPSRRLKRTALRAFGWRTSSPASGRSRGASRAEAEGKVEKAKAVIAQLKAG